MAAYNMCLQISFIVINVVFVVLGAVMIGLGAWLEIQQRDLIDAIESEAFLYGPYLIIAAGCAVVIVAIIGIIGALFDKKINRFLLSLYIVLMVVVLLVQLAGGILGFVFREELNDIVTEGLTSTINSYGLLINEGITRSWDTVQTELMCCGLNGVADWVNSSAMFDAGDNFPDSCCIEPPITTCNINETYIKGCQQAVIDLAQEQLLIVAAVALGFIVIEIVVIFMAFYMVCFTDFEE